MSLKRKILQGELADPLSRKFNIQQWEACRDPASQEDADFLLSATKIREYAIGILNSLEETAYADGSPGLLIRALIGYANFVAQQFSLLHHKQVKSVGAYVASTFPRVRDKGENEFSIADMNTVVIDSLRLPIPQLFGKKIREDAPSDSPEVDVVPVISLASSWYNLRHIWEHCLFLGYTLIERDDVLELTGPGRDYFVLGKARQMHNAESESLMRSRVREHAERAKNDLKFLLHRKGLELLRKPGKSRSLDAEHGLDSFLIDHILPTPVGNEHLNIKFRHLMMTFDLLSKVAQSCADRAIHRLSSIIGDQNFSQLTEDDLCQFSAASVLAAIQLELTLDAKTAAEVLKMLTYSGEASFDPWATPVIDMGDGSLALLSGVLGPANRAFVLESIMRSLKFDMETRGPSFERFVQQTLQSALESCPYRTITWVSTPSVVIEIGEEKEEVDLFLAIGRDLYILECKCVLFPVEIPDEAHFKRKLETAELQLRRKLSFVTKHLSQLAEENSAFSGLRAPPAHVFGIIITNFSGGPYYGLTYPVISPGSLIAYFSEGASRRGLTLTRKGAIVGEEAIRYYDSFSSFRKNFWKFVTYAPHVQTFKRFLRKWVTRMPFGDLGLKDILVPMEETIVPDNQADRDKCFDDMAVEFRQLLTS